MMNNRTKRDGEEYNALADAERFLEVIQALAGQPTISDQKLRAQTIARHEAECLEQILPALIEAREIIGHIRLAKWKKTLLMNQLAHASEHLTDNLERMRRASCDEE